FAVGNTALVNRQASLIPLRWVKGERAQRALLEKWNAFSRIWVGGDLSRPKPIIPWGISADKLAGRTARQLAMNIDSTAGTVITGFDGDLASIDYLRYDVTNLAHHLRPDAKVLVVGVGGGRDVLSALVFRQREVVGVELNGDILRIVNETFGPFTGHL